MSRLALHHINIDTAKPAETIEFYERVLGLENRPHARPASARPGAWLFTGDHPIVHLHFVDDVASATGPFNHVAFVGGDFDAMVSHLSAHGVDFAEQHSEAMDQLFFVDPNGIRIEFNFAKEPQTSKATS